jgi:hypothetical protein
MCTAIVSIGPVVLLAGVRDEFTGRAWEPPARHWPQYPGVTGGLDLVAGGTWLALASAARRVACVLNGRGRLAPTGSRRSRGVLPLQAVVDGKLAQTEMADFDPFHLLIVEPGQAGLVSWNGERLTEQELAPGLHMVVNSGLDTDLLRRAETGGDGPGAARDHELARMAYFLPRLRAAARPDPRPRDSVSGAWGGWLPLINGDGIGPDDPRALVVRHDVGGGRIYGTTSISLVALRPDGVRYDFTGRPGDPGGWWPVPLPGDARTG